MKLELKNPVEPFWINQIFGVDKARYSQFNLNGHNGLDLFTLHGQLVFASHDGIATYEVDSSQGHGVVVTSETEFEIPGADLAYVKTLYWHLCDPKKEPKFASPVWKFYNDKKNKGKVMKVKAGDLIGYADTTGYSTGDHLHYGLKPQHKNSKGKLYNALQANGFLGAIDPLPFMKKDKPSFDGSIVSAQKCLRFEGFFPANVEYFENLGPVTRSALVGFQKKHGIAPALGVFGPITKAKLRELYP